MNKTIGTVLVHSPAMRQLPIVVVLLILVASCTNAGQPDHSRTPDTRYPTAIEDKIRQVESHLCLNPADGINWTLADRMKYYSVEGLSIAVIHNNQVEWARGYGWADVSEQRPVTTHTL